MNTLKNVKTNPLSLSLQTIANLIGEEKALCLSKRVRHRHVYIRKHFNERDKLIPIIGRFALSILRDKYPGELIHITPKDGYSAEAVRLLKAGHSIQSIAVRFHVSQARITTIAKSHRINPPVEAGRGRGGVGSSAAQPCGGKGCPTSPVVTGKKQPLGL